MVKLIASNTKQRCALFFKKLFSKENLRILKSVAQIKYKKHASFNVTHLAQLYLMGEAGISQKKVTNCAIKYII